MLNEQYNAQNLSGQFNDILNGLKSQFPKLNLSADDLKRYFTSADDLIYLISERTGMSEDETSKKVFAILDGLHLENDDVDDFKEAKQKDDVFIEKIETKFRH